MTNIERLTARLNAHGCRRSIYNALFALAPLIREVQTDHQPSKILENLLKGGERHDGKRRV